MENLIKTDTTEKITININGVDLGYIDMLVKEGYYATRTEFIKTAVKKQLDKHAEDSKRLIEKNKSYGYEISVGIGGFTKGELEKIILKKGNKIKIIFVGIFIVPKDVPLGLLEQAVESIKVYGVSRCSQEIKERYGL